MRLIDADALKAQAYKGGAFDYQYVVDLSDIVDASTIDAVPVAHGRVVENGNPICGPCSNCGESVNRKWNFCPHCGARMDAPDQ